MSKGFLDHKDFNNPKEKTILRHNATIVTKDVRHSILRPHLSIYFNKHSLEKAVAKWKCLEGKFETSEPDRSECVHDWIKDLEKLVIYDTFNTIINSKNFQIEDSNITSINISATLRNKVNDTDLYGGDVLELGQMMNILTQKHSIDMLENSEAENWKFSENIFAVTDIIIKSTIAWLEVTEAPRRYDCTSKIVSNVDQVGNLFLTISSTSNCSPSQYNFTSNHLTVKMTNLGSNCSSPVCFPFSTGNICVPSTIYESFKKDSVANVATEFKIQNTEEMMFPNNMLINKHNQSSLIGLSVENGSLIVLPEDGESVKIIFESDNEESEGSCMYWDLEADDWSDTGCYYNQDMSDSQQITCDCYHLTNFGIIMDFTGKANPFNVFLDYFTTITLIISMVFIFTTELVLFYIR